MTNSNLEISVLAENPVTETYTQLRPGTAQSIVGRLFGAPVNVFHGVDGVRLVPLSYHLSEDQSELRIVYKVLVTLVDAGRSLATEISAAIQSVTAQ